MSDWYAVYSRPREEAIAEENLKRQGFQTYWPRYRKRVSHARKVQDVTASLFPRYLFVKPPAGNSELRAVRSTRGVAGLVCHGLEPTTVAEQLVEEIRAREDDQGFVVLGRQIELRRGQRIQLASGALKGLDIVFEAQKDNERVVALLGLLGREFKVAVPLRDVVPLG